MPLWRPLGFTGIGMHAGEAIALFIVLAMVAVLVATNLPAVWGTGVYTTAHQIAADIRFARHLAIIDAADHAVIFIPDPSTPGRFARYEVRNSRTGEGVVDRAIEEGVDCSGTPQLILRPNGSAATAGTLSCTGEGVTYKVTLSRLTGRVAVTRVP